MADFRLPQLNLGERCYRALLRLYPPRFRRAFAQDLIEAFRDARRDARAHHVSSLLFWAAAVQDVLTQAFAEWMSTLSRAARGVDRFNEEESPMAVLSNAFRAAELSLALRRLRRAPGFAIAAIVVLAVGIGATTTVFSLVNGVLLSPLPFPSPDQLVLINHTVQLMNVKTVDQSDATVMLYQRRTIAFDGIAAWRVNDANLSVLGSAAEPERVNAARTTANLLRVLRVRPAFGRDFEGGEDGPGAPRVAILSYRFWARRMRGDSTAIGRQIAVNGVPRTIVGIMPASFAYPSGDVDLWMPVTFDPAHADPGSFNYTAIGRLKDGVTFDEAQADLARVLPRLLDDYASPIPRAMWEQAHVTPQVAGLRESIVGGASRLLWILLASVGLVLAIACANVAGLFLVRAESRQLELAVRGALGSGIAGLLAQSLSESLVLASAGGVLGLALAAISTRIAVRTGSTLGLPRLDEVGMDARVLVFVGATVILAALIVSVLPMLRARRVSIAMVLRGGGGRGSTSDGTRQRARNALVVAQTALALVLVASAGLMARSVIRLQRVQPGFDADGVVMTRVVLPYATYHTAVEELAFLDNVQHQVRALPGVRDVAVTDWVPLTSDHSDGTFEVEGQQLGANAVPPDHLYSAVNGSFFHTLGIPMLRGTTFGTQDPAHPRTEAIVSRAFAERYWPGASPLGKHLKRFHGTDVTIIGEVGDVHYEGLDKPASEFIYFPTISDRDSATSTMPYATIVVRSALSSGTTLAGVRGIIRSLDPTLPTFDERALADVLRDASARTRAVLLLLAAASGVALLLGAVGLYGVMAYSVSLRRREIGVRVALGARPSDVSRMVSLDGLRLAAIGVALGVVAAIGVTRFLRSLLYDVSATDPLTIGGTAVALLLVALLASWLPARRAASIDPSEALRSS